MRLSDCAGRSEVYDTVRRVDMDRPGSISNMYDIQVLLSRLQGQELSLSISVLSSGNR